jgi:hypothetical protein
VVAEPLTSRHQSSWLPSVALGQKPTCTFVSGAVHTLQRVHRVNNERARGFRHRLNMRCDVPPREAGSIQVSSGVAHLVPFDMFSVFGSLAVVLHSYFLAPRPPPVPEGELCMGW